MIRRNTLAADFANGGVFRRASVFLPLATLATLATLALAIGSAHGEADPNLVRGRLLFHRYCAACHGVYGTGDGPVAPYLTIKPPDLTRLHERYGSPLHRSAVAEFIDGRRDVVAHGLRDMPVWGERLYPDAGNDPIAETLRREIIERIIDHLATIQGKLESKQDPLSKIAPPA